MSQPPVKQKIEAPASTDSTTVEPLGYLEARDSVLAGEYTFVAYKETERSSGNWRVRVASSQTAGGSFEPAAIEAKALTTSEQGKPYFIWGYNFEPTQGDPRQIEFRVYVSGDGKPTEIELYARLRKADHSPQEPKSVRFPWPGGAK